jgi:tetratricopeptide (TPR) repeat protein
MSLPGKLSIQRGEAGAFVIVCGLYLVLLHPGSLVAQDSPASGPYAEKAAELAQRGDLKGAESELRKAVELSPKDPQLLTSLGGILGMEGKLSEANGYLAKAVELRPDNGLFRRNLAANEWQLGRFDQARANLEQLLRANPADKGSIFVLGMVCENQKDYARSIALLESIPEVAKHKSEAFVALASSYYHTNRREDAKAALKKLPSLPASPEVLLMGGRVAMDARDYALAIEIATNGVGRFPSSYELFLAKASAEMELRYFSQAVKSARRAEEIHPCAEAKRELALAQWRAGDKTQATAGFERAIRESPRDSAIYETYGTLLLEDRSPGNRDRAIALLKQAIALDSSSFEAQYQLGNVELAAGQFDAARKDLERAIQLNPADSRAHFAMSRVYRRLGRDSDADRELESYQKLKATQN